MQSWGSWSPHSAVSAEHLDLCGELSGSSRNGTCRESAHARGQSLSPVLSPISSSHELSQEELRANGSVGTALRQWHSLRPCSVDLLGGTCLLPPPQSQDSGREKNLREAETTVVPGGVRKGSSTCLLLLPPPCGGLPGPVLAARTARRPDWLLLAASALLQATPTLLSLLLLRVLPRRRAASALRGAPQPCTPASPFLSFRGPCPTCVFFPSSVFSGNYTP